ncbi:MAG: hypothetical protein IJ689_00555 [Alphaproteobacteria bacterium]|nr:hypothetical protein [Alphaproteobacteria bacterium]
MKRLVNLLIVTFLVTLSSCYYSETAEELEEYGGPPSVSGSGLTYGDDTDFYTAWVKISRGRKETFFQKQLRTITETDSVMSPVVVKKIDEPRFWYKQNRLVAKQNDGRFETSTIRTECFFDCGDCSVAVATSFEQAFVVDGEYLWAMPKASFEVEPKGYTLMKLEDEQIDAKCYEVYLLTCRMIAFNDFKTVECQTSVKLLIERVPITFDAVVVDYQ